MTKEERHLWYDYLKSLPITISRQKVIDNYIVDFCCSSAKVIIEIDGSQHYEDLYHKTDEKRDQFFNNNGYTVLRYSNYEINFHFESVCEDIHNHIFKSK